MTELADEDRLGTWKTLRCERGSNATAVLTLDRPDRLNVMNLAMRDELADCLEHIHNDPGVRALVVTGAGEAFSAGGDINDFVDQDGEQLHELMRERSHRWFRRLWELPIPVVAAVNGVAAGGGVNLALACDVLLASPEARFGQTFGKVGLAPDLGGMHLLPRAVGLHRAKAMCFTGELVDASVAHELGMVHRVLPAADLITESVAFAESLAHGSQQAFAASKAVLNRSFELSMDETLQMELYTQSFLFTTEEHRTRINDFLKKNGRKK